MTAWNKRNHNFFGSLITDIVLLFLKTLQEDWSNIFYADGKPLPLRIRRYLAYLSWNYYGAESNMNLFVVGGYNYDEEYWNLAGTPEVRDPELAPNCPRLKMLVAMMRHIKVMGALLPSSHPQSAISGRIQRESGSQKPAIGDHTSLIRTHPFALRHIESFLLLPSALMFIDLEGGTSLALYIAPATSWTSRGSSNFGTYKLIMQRWRFDDGVASSVAGYTFARGIRAFGPILCGLEPVLEALLIDPTTQRFVRPTYKRHQYCRYSPCMLYISDFWKIEHLTGCSSFAAATASVANCGPIEKWCLWLPSRFQSSKASLRMFGTSELVAT
ncbi:hypothetical protein C8R44DRAFT_857644 [Mycena epipterygia]|nr:hypothetical protein C8R44DRAFT_857644 [Mycena epipterygia]